MAEVITTLQTIIRNMRQEENLSNDSYRIKVTMARIQKNQAPRTSENIVINIMKLIRLILKDNFNKATMNRLIMLLILYI